jgi:UDP-N-acetylmuramoyl-tripeptide--D-alanyl-D-alanine ligase
MISMTFGEMASVMNGELFDISESDIFTGEITTDSRAVKPGDLFVAIKGLTHDGHDYIAQAKAQGAIAVVAAKPISDTAHILVKEESSLDEIFSQPTIWALAKLAKFVHNKLNNLITIAITGSSGKTTTKDMVSQLGPLLGECIFAKESANNEIGVPLTVLSCDEETKVLILEMGARRVGNIKYLVDIAKPNLAIITHIGSAHIEIFGSLENLRKTKAEIVKDLSQNDYAILNADDPNTAIVRDLTKAKVFLFGLSDQSDVYARNIAFDASGRPNFEMVFKGESAKVELQHLGVHNVSNALAAAAAFLIQGIDLKTVAQLLSKAKSVSKWRMQEVFAPQEVLIINDAYNANPESTKAALAGLTQIAQRRRKIAILGEMKELGELSESAHQDIGKHAAQLGIDHLLVVGVGAKPAVFGANSVKDWKGEATFHENIAALMDYAKQLVTGHDVVLVKASRSIGLEVVVDQLVEKLGEK